MNVSSSSQKPPATSFSSSARNPSSSRVRVPREVRKAQILAAAHQQFVEFGYHGASMDAIAEVASVSKPVLYQHFPGKLELYAALLDHHLATLTRALIEALASTTDNKERVRATIFAYFHFIDTERKAYRLIFESDLVSEPAISDRLEAFNSRFASAIAEVISQDTDLPAGQTKLLGRALAGAAQVSARAWVAENEEDRPAINTAVDLIANLAWRGISRFPKDEH